MTATSPTAAEAGLQQLAFDGAEYRRRVARVQALLSAHGLEGLLCTTPATVCYLTGYESVAVEKFWLALLPAEGEPALLVEDFESHNARASCWLEGCATYGLGKDPIAAAAELAGAHGLAGKRLGVELAGPTTLSAAGYLRLRELLPEAELIDATGLVGRAQAIKSPAEIEKLRRAGAISAAAMNAAIAAAREGGTDNDVAAAGYEALHARGSEYMCYPWFVTVGRRSGVPHTTFRRVELRRGDPVFLEVGACVSRYSAPMMRTAVIGEAEPLHRRMAEACIASVERLIEHARPGATGDEVARRAGEALRGLPEGLVWHGYYGYSVGLGFPPTWADCLDASIAVGSATVLRPGMVLHANTSLREIGRRGASCSETLLITDRGCEVLTEGCPRELAVR